MTFIGRLKKTSHIYSTWRGSRRIQGTINTATFRLAPGMEYVTDVLTADQVADLRLHPAVQIEMVEVLPKIAEAPIEVPVESGPVIANPEVLRPRPPPFIPRHQYHPPRRKGRR
jgi:hypothetical protein